MFIVFYNMSGVGCGVRLKTYNTGLLTNKESFPLTKPIDEERMGLVD